MAYERSRTTAAAQTGNVRADSLDYFVKGLSEMYKTQIAVRNAKDETKFNEEVLAGNISLEQQLSYRQSQLKRIVDDPTERTRVRGEVSNLKDRIEQQKFTDGWSSKLADFQGGIVSVDSVISFLNDTKANTQDQNILNTVNQKLADMQAQKFSLTQDLIKNSTQYATNSQSVDVIDKQISKVQNYKNDAKLAGEDQLVSLYDLQIQSLNQAKNNAQVQNDILNLGAVSATGAYGAISLLDAINQRINTASTSGPVTVGGTTYATTKDFWLNKRDSFISDSSSSGFFPELTNDIKNSLVTKQSKNALTIADLQQASQKLDSLMARTEMRNYSSQVSIYKQSILQDGANQLMDTIQNEFARTLNVNKAVSQLTTVKNLGVNVDKAYTDILNSNASTKNSQVQNILSAAQQAMKNNPGLSPEQAVQESVKAGAGYLISPLDAAGQTEGALAKGAITTAAGGLGKNDVRTTTTGLPSGQSSDTPTAGIYVIGKNYGGKVAPSGQVYINKNGTVLLRPENNPTPELNAPTAQDQSAASNSGIQILGQIYNGKNAGNGNVYILKDGVLLKRPADNPTPELNNGSQGASPSDGNTGPLSWFNDKTGKDEYAPAGMEYVPGTNQLRPIGSGSSASATVQKQTSTSSGGGTKSSSSSTASKVNIKVVGPSYNGHTAKSGNTYVLKDGVLLERSASNPTPELN